MSTDTKYQVMGELLGIMPSAIERAEAQASRIIEMVKGEGRFAPVIRCPNGTGVDLDQYLEEPASVKVQPVEFTTEDLSCLKDRGHTWAEIAAEAGITPDAARKRVEKWRAKQKEFYDTPTNEPNNDMEPIGDLKEEADESLTVEDSLRVFIKERFACRDLDIEILQAVKRNFPGISISVKDIANMRRCMA